MECTKIFPNSSIKFIILSVLSVILSYVVSGNATERYKKISKPKVVS